MLKEERQNLILNQLHDEKKVLSSEVCKQYKVSEDTIRRDLKELASQGKLLKVHGGALVTSQNVFSYREDEIFDHDKKLTIAQKALSLIENNDVIVLGGGTTILELANILPDDLTITVYTYSLPVAMRLADHPRIETIFFGGRIMKKPRITIGLDMIQYVGEIRADVCFLGASGIDINSGLMEIDLEVAQLKNTIAKVSDRVVVLSTYEKIETKQRFMVCRLDKITTLITELDSNFPKLSEYRKRGLEIL
ncbi:MAG: DeoR/GlpR family DNA-binding transcription regulator [Bacteroidota bacterium]